MFDLSYKLIIVFIYDSGYTRLRYFAILDVIKAVMTETELCPMSNVDFGM